MSTKATKTIMITAGEPSGDLLGASLMEALKKAHPNVRFIGVGGQYMMAQGLLPLFPMAELSVMGLLEVIPAIPRIFYRIRQLCRFAISQKPDVVITIDSQEFSKYLGKCMHKHGFKVIHYVSPTVWAWRPNRVHGMKTYLSHVLALYPFEPPFYAQVGLPCTYVGHPVATRMAEYAPTKATKRNPTPVLALLPGSRESEIRRHWPLFLQTFLRLRQVIPTLHAVLALPDDHALQLCRQVAPWPPELPLTFTLGEQRFEALQPCRAALAKSGTSNLELAMLGLPAVVAYQTSAVTYAIARHMVEVAHISPTNLVAGQVVYPEFIQSAASPENLARALYPIITDETTHTRQRHQLGIVRSQLATPYPPADIAAQVILKSLKN